jgi:hypothetical protein
MKEGALKLLLQYFPTDGSISYDEFIYTESGGGMFMHNFDCNEDKQRQGFELISRPWTEIDWFAVTNIDSDCWMLPISLNRKTFIHTFPSLLNFVAIAESINEITTLGELLADCFVDQLNYKKVRQDWKREYYSSLNIDVKKLVYSILKNNEDIYMEAKNIINGYWNQWAAW